MINPLYIKSARAITAQDCFNSNDLSQASRPCTGNRFVYVEPDYSRYFTIMQLRRMSRLTRIGLVAAIECLKDAGIAKPEAILTGTGKGSLNDTEKFMHAIRSFQEGTLNPSPFIQSTYNALNGLIGLHHQVNSYNTTYVHSGFSLEHALLDAALLMGDNTIRNALIGSFEEMTDEHYIIKEKLGFWKSGAVSGEGSFFFFAQQDKTGAVLAIEDLQLLFEPDQQKIRNAVHALLAAHQLQWQDIDVYISGRNKDTRYDSYYDLVSEQLTPATTELQFKQLTGEFDTASGFGLWAATRMVETGQLFPALVLKKGTSTRIKHLLFYNQYYSKQHVLYLLKAVE
ncbi:beta-ketoacyl synthase chain length factor [Flavihumibacter sp. CACIAM 22H1]|uniref:beta-ketoacyl synthase chain length factor n=1 Tax=Flavihumibacter sp. CACIAM 22H1 TaxID=1812911 RepID=UPI0007A86F6F|nr:beta-ketoacyl synthase chain length factor [Flavihumibacter sp. CACIAM 22H1]KYP13981.1 MAG: hypothetical protein A1D16_16265 [Flavihumibacter sp. CACIAM 22H1]